MKARPSILGSVRAFALVASLIAAFAAHGDDTVLFSEDFNKYPPKGGLVKDAGWESGSKKDDIFLAGGGRRGPKDLFVDGSTTIPEEKGGTSVTWFSKPLDHAPAFGEGRYVVFEADLRGGPGGGPDAITSNCSIWLLDKRGGHPGCVGKWIRAYDQGELAWTLAVSKETALAEDPSHKVRSRAKGGQWVRVRTVVDSEAHTVQGMVVSSGGKTYTKAFAIRPKFSLGDIEKLVIRQDLRSYTFGLDIDNIVVRQTDENPIPKAKRSPVVGAPAKVALGDAPAEEGRIPKWLDPSDEFVSDHIKWAKPAAGGPMRVLFITYRNGQREIVEICQRFDIEREVFATEMMREFSRPALRHPETLAGTRPHEQEARLKRLLAKDYDCIVVGNIKWDILPEWARESIKEKIRKGTGLVAHVKSGYYEDLREMLAERVVEARQALGAFPYAGLPAFRTFGTFEHFAERALCFAKYDKGRIALILGRAPEGAAGSLAAARGLGEGIRCPERQMLTCEIVDSFPDFQMIEYDYYLALAGHLMRWAGGWERAVRVVEPATSAHAIERDAREALPLHLWSAGTTKVDLHVVARRADTGAVVSEQEKSMSLAKGDTAVQWKAPVLPAGAYFFDVWAKEGDTVLDYGSLLVDVRSSKRIEFLELAGLTFSKTDKVRGSVVLGGADASAKIEIVLWDNHGRCLARSIIELSRDNTDYPFEIALAATPLSPLGFVEAKLIAGDEVLDVKRATFTYWDLFPPRDDVRAIVAQGYKEDSYLDVTLAKALGDMGFDTLMTHGGMNVYYADALRGSAFERWVRPPLRVDSKNVHAGAALLANVRDLMSLYNGVDGQYDWYISPRGSHVENSRGAVRRPCLTNPAYERHYRSFYAGEARRYRPLAVGEYNMGDECTFVHGDHDVCFSDTCTSSFQDFVRAEYGTVERLNEEYGSKYSDWSEVVPIPFEKAKEAGQIPIWIDHRRHMETVWAGYFRAARAAIEAEVPGALVGYEGSDEPGHIRAARIGGAEDYELLAHAMTMNGTYLFHMQLDCVRDFSAPGTLIGGGWFGGYPAIWRSGRDDRHSRWWIWNTLLRGANTWWVYKGSDARQGDGHFATVAPDFSPYAFFKGSLGEMRWIKRGLGKLLMHAKRPNDGVAVLYSPSSMLMTAFEDELPHRWDSAAAAPFLLDEAGFQYRMISESQLESGMLRKEGFRALYLPYCQALSPKETQEILAFAKAGGVVMADLRPGVVDEHGKPYEQSPLDALFGVKQTPAAAKPQKEPMQVTAGFAGLEGAQPPARSDASLALAGGQAKAKVADAPAVVVNEYGQGFGVLFNYAFSDYMTGNLCYAPSFADDATADVARKLIQGALALADIGEPIAMKPHVPGTHVFRFDTGAGQVLGLLWDAPGFLPGIKYHEQAKVDIAAGRKKTVTLLLDEARHIYDIRTGEYIGKKRRLDRTIRPGLVGLLSALAYRVTGLSIAGDADGATISAEIDGDEEASGMHVFRVEVADPQGNDVKAYAQNALAPGGTCRVVIPFALDDAAGDWTITATDVLTGVTAKAVIELSR